MYADFKKIKQDIKKRWMRKEVNINGNCFTA